jgi:peptidoglycan hydrolase CwlO-like protein
VKKRLRFLTFSVAAVAVVVFALRPLSATASENCENIVCPGDTASDEFLSCTKKKQGCWEEKIAESKGAANTLTNTLNILNGQLAVQELQIVQTKTEIAKLEKEITELLTRIAGLDISLDRLSSLLISRAQEHYKRSHYSPLMTFLTSKDLSQSLVTLKYLNLAQTQTAEAMQRAESQKQTYDTQKALKESKQAEVQRKKAQLETQIAGLSKQRSEQQFLLQETKNNEAKYQRELEKTMAELEAIQSIISGRGEETEVKQVNQGDNIASIIAGASPCSTGTHLHFEVVKDGAHRDPAGYLKSIDGEWNNSPDGSFGFGGSWEWPLNNPAKINQGYGMTYYARVKRAYGGSPHTGIDMASKTSGDYTVKAVQAGTLFRGSIQCGSGKLRYVKVAHKEGGMETYYLHVNY